MPDYDSYTYDEINATTKFGKWRHHTVGVVAVWPDRESWQSFTEPNALYENWAKESYIKAIGLPIFPEHIGDSARECAMGAYNGYWREFAQTMESTGLASENTIIRLGWEFNINKDWGTPVQFAACWRQIVSTVRTIAPKLRWDWNVNRGITGSMPGYSVLQAYPGNGFVDIVGVDSYNFWPPSTVNNGWQQQLNGEFGLNYWLRFAISHGKKFSVPEWGLTYNIGRNDYNIPPGRIDDPSYIDDMYDFFKENSSVLAYECYFDAYLHSIYEPNNYPLASAEYVRLWSRLRYRSTERKGPQSSISYGD